MLVALGSELFPEEIESRCRQVGAVQEGAGQLQKLVPVGFQLSEAAEHPEAFLGFQDSSSAMHRVSLLHRRGREMFQAVVRQVQEPLQNRHFCCGPRVMRL